MANFYFFIDKNSCMNISIINERIYPINACIANKKNDVNKKILFCGTGFFYNQMGEVYFVTSLNVVAGRDIYTGETKNLNHYVPNSLSFMVSVKSSLEKQELFLPLYDEDLTPVWFVHPVKKREIDIAVIPLKNQQGLKSLNDFEGNFNNFNQDVFVLGYPLYINQKERGQNPCLENRTILSNNEDCFFITPLNQSGFCGAPVFMEQENSLFPVFVGIYSGVDSNIQSSFSKECVWKAELIDEIIDAKLKDESYI